MAFPDDVLTDDEEVVLHLHPHWGSLVVPVLSVVTALALMTLGVFFVPDNFAREALQYLVLALGLAAIGYFGVAPWLRWITTHFVFTTERLIIREGVVNHTGRDIPLVWLSNVSWDQSLPDRLVGAGTLSIESAGQRGPIILTHVPRVEEVYATLRELADAADLRRRSGG
ncbi:PH domain-containing protein [Parafrankia irregularis]|uniref:PH domain-containing protein n=1 Tax=Parafrankia irregularis TaxID=795642 RepID=A0A0S4QGV8_9ACTN|nr:MULTISPECIES: PH domain-containing protein [Parafrankia]MBE3202910.1 PH domain-containing protein [Parafrankia sp. CH37]CUU54462.1 PH domain-containing protein [Parafrankia irregularis]